MVTTVEMMVTMEMTVAQIGEMMRTMEMTVVKIGEMMVRMENNKVDNHNKIVKMEKMVRMGSKLITPIIKGIYECISDTDQGDITIEGVDNLIGYPEYSEKESLQGVLGIGRQKDRLLDLISENDDSDDVHIFIGSENVIDSMTNSSLIYKTVKKDGRVIGAVGVIGPRRMEYSKVIATVENLAKGVSEIISGDGDSRGLLLGDGTKSDKKD